jgi:threonine synthase
VAVPPERRVTLGEGDTPLVPAPRLAASIGLERLYLKREGLNPTGSHKARGAAFQVPAVAATAAGRLAWVTVSSSGNAAVAIAAYARPAGVGVAAFLSAATPAAKLAPLARFGANVFLCATPLHMAEEFAAATGAPNLRPSVHPLAVDGFLSLGWELAEARPEADAIFTFVSSGASFVGLGRALDRAGTVVGRHWPAALHAVQGTGGASVAAADEPERARLPAGTLGELAGRKTRRLGEARRWMAATGGRGWVVTDAEAAAALELLLGHGIDTSLEGAASLAAAGRAAAETGLRSAVVVLTGHASQRPDYASLAAGARVRQVATVAEAVAALGGPPPAS